MAYPSPNMAIQGAQSTLPAGVQPAASTLPNPELMTQFQSMFNDASTMIEQTALAANADNNQWAIGERLKRKKEKQITQVSLDQLDKISVAQQQGVVQNASDASPSSLNKVPLQLFLDNAIRALEHVSKQEFKMNTLMDQFVKGNVSEDEVVLQTAKLNLSISMVTTIVQSAVQTFKEIQQIPV